MSASITNYFKPSPPKKVKKRKLSELEKDEQTDAIKPSKITPDTASTVTNNPISGQSVKKQKKTTEEKEESDDNENGDKDAKESITYANCYKLLDESWKEHLSIEFKKAYFVTLCSKLQQAQNENIQIFPKVNDVFRAFELCKWPMLKAVIVGQDPYHNDNQAEGLCFSVQKGVKIPSSLRNMLKEAKEDVGFKDVGHGSLSQWGEQGVLLLNTVLTVQAHKANSHKKFGWQTFTDAVIRTISKEYYGVVFILWGKQAQLKKKIIDTNKHKIIESSHPSGLSAHRGFFGSKPNSKCNALLKELGKEEINWQIDASK